MFINKLDVDDLMEGLDAIEQVNALSEMNKLTESEREARTPMALEIVKEQHPDYAPGGSKEGKTFVHADKKFQVKVDRDYNYGNHSSEFAHITAEYNRVRREQAARTKMLNALRKQILNDHPRLQPTKVTVTLKCLGAVEKNNN